MSTTLSPGYIAWSAVKPALRILFLLGIGFAAARRGHLSPQSSRALAYLYINVFFPCLFFYIGLGLLLGLLILLLFNPPRATKGDLVVIHRPGVSRNRGGVFVSSLESFTSSLILDAIHSLTK